MKRNTELICECGHRWQERLHFDIERRWETTGVDGLLANAVTRCPECEYKGLARGIVPDDSSQLKFYLKQENSLYFPRGGWKPSSTKKSSAIFNLAKELNIHLYEEPAFQILNLEKIAHYLGCKLDNASMDIKQPFLNDDSLSNKKFFEKMLKAKIHDFSDPHFEPSSIEPEQPLISEKVVYDGFKLLSALHELIDENKLKLQLIHLIFTRCFFGTWDEKDKRYHLRLSIYGFPSLVSLTGVIEAPAKPSEFYRVKQRAGEELPEELSEKFLTYNDKRLTEVLKGISMQAIFYHLIGEPFCIHPRCRLFNAHWQEELMQAQMNKPEFCASHRKILENLNKG